MHARLARGSQARVSFPATIGRTALQPQAPSQCVQGNLAGRQRRCGSASAAPLAERLDLNLRHHRRRYPTLVAAFRKQSGLFEKCQK